MTAGDLSAERALAELSRAVVIVCEVEPSSVSGATRLAEDLAADSLALVEIVDIAEAALVPFAAPGFHFDDAVLDALPTLGDMVDHAVAQDAVARSRT